MRTPQPAPKLESIDTSRQFQLINDHGRQIAATDQKGRYLHWDEFRYKTPPEGVHVQDAWLLSRIRRRFQAIYTPFFDKNGFPFGITVYSGLQNKLHQIDRRACGTLSSTSTKLEQSDGRQYLIRSLIEEPFSSSVLEGAATTRERAKEMILQKEAPRSEGDQMVLNNYLAMEFIRQHVEEPLTVELVHEIHRIITDKTLNDPKMAGQFRSANHDINVVDSITGEYLHIPPPAAELNTRMTRLCQFANEDYTEAEPFFHPIIRAIMLHFMLAYDHPYIDGNGRTARALFYWYALKQGYWLIEYISISKLIREAPNAYGMAFLYTEDDDGDATYFVLHQLDVILGALDALDEYIDQKKRERSEFQGELENTRPSKDLNNRQITLLEEAIKNPTIHFTMNAHSRRFGISYLTARKDLDDLANDGYLTRTNGRPILFKPHKRLAELLGRQR